MRNTTEKRKLLGAVLSAVVMAGILLVVTLCMLLDYFGTGGNGAETVVILICAAGGLAIVVGIGLALGQRVKEIKGGEEDEARKY